MERPGDDVLALVLKYLRAAERTGAELRAHLARKGVASEAVETAVAWAMAKGYVDDERVREREIELAKHDRKVGRAKVVARLERRGVNTGEANTGYGDEEEVATALRLIESRPDMRWDKAARLLGSRGFSEETIRAVLEQVYPDAPLD